MLYSQKIRHYAAEGEYAGRLADPDGIGEVGLAGQEAGRRLAVRFTLRVKDDSIADIRFQVFGCGFTIAACAAAARWSRGQRIERVQALTAGAISRLLGGLPDERSYCADLANEALQAAIVSAINGSAVESASLPEALDEAAPAPRCDDDALYCALLSTPSPPGVSSFDRHMFAGLLAAVRRQGLPSAALGLSEKELAQLLDGYFPGFERSALDVAPGAAFPAASTHQDMLTYLLAQVPEGRSGARRRTSVWLAKMLAARCAQPGHLWVAMGFSVRSDLTAAIRRHLSALAAANSKGMRWKRFLFKKVCEMNGAQLCKSPNCGDCSDYALCFSDED